MEHTLFANGSHSVYNRCTLNIAKHKMKQKILLATIAIAAVFCTFSCSEDDGTVDEYPNWQSKNETFFNHLSDSVKALLEADSTRTDWKRIKSWTKASAYVGSNADYVIVNVVSDGQATDATTPKYTDSVSIHYAGHLLPSTSYRQGLRFDASYDEPFDESISVASKLLVSATVEGFATALQNMHRGDHWIVYIPYQLGYGTSAKSSIPAYSTLVFDIRLKDFWRTKSTE